MKRLTRLVGFFSASVFCSVLVFPPTAAQIVPDNTLPHNSLAIPQGNLIQIVGGTRAGNNLFHSFTQFSVPTGGTAFFKNEPAIQNIFSRVTGSDVSNINGILKANGTANLFLLNPNGIIFGAGAQLNIGGSFLATTASSIKFADGREFLSDVTQTTPILTVSVPVGLGFGNNPGKIRVVGNGYKPNLSSTFYPFKIGRVSGLQVQAGKTLALIGGDLALDGGILAAEDGRIELGSVGEGAVSINQTSQGWSLDYGGVSDFQNIRLSQRSLVNGSGHGGGAIQFQGKRVSLSDGSLALLQNQGLQPGGKVGVNASESLEEYGTSSDAKVSSGLFAETIAEGSGGDIAVKAPRLVLQGGAKIIARTFSSARAGNIIVNAPESMQLVGFSLINPNVISIINNTSYGSGQAGNIQVSTGQLTVLSGAGVTSDASDTGSGGDVTLNVAGTTSVIGVNPINYAPSILGSATFWAGNAGNIIINTSKLVVMNGGRVSATTLASGNAGNVVVNAKDSVEVSGTVPRSINPSFIDSSADVVDKIIQQLIGLPPAPSGTSGDVAINAPRLLIQNGGLVSVKNAGSGNAGSLRVNVASIFLDDGGSITASTASVKVVILY